jgi:CHAD domain-containing protein
VCAPLGERRIPTIYGNYDSFAVLEAGSEQVHVTIERVPYDARAVAGEMRRVGPPPSSPRRFRCGPATRLPCVEMGDQVEREVKLVPGDGFQLPQLGEPQPTRDFVSTYLDTTDLRLARHGLTLRHRVEDGTGVWQLKIPRGEHRVELEEPGPPARPPSKLLDLLVAHLRGRELVRVARLRTRRQTQRADGAEIVDDSVAVLEGQRVTGRFRELEVELLDGDENALRRLEKALREAGAQPGDLTPKLYRVLDLTYPPESAELPPDAAPLAVLQAALVEQHARMLAHDPGTRLGSDPEDLHQMRVATRRARAYLRAARPLLDRAWAKELRDELGWLGSELGPARDLDVLLEHVREEVSAVGDAGAPLAGLVSSLEHDHAAARSTAVAALSDDRYFALLDRLENVEPVVDPDADESLAELWWAQFKRTRKGFRDLGASSSDEELHAARILGKRARYSAELAAGELGKRGEKFVSAAKKLQDILGEHQDSAVAEGRIAEWAKGKPAAAEAVERLLDGERERRKRAREEWPGAWKKLKKRARKAKP